MSEVSGAGQKNRKGRTISKDGIAHYQKILVALSETIRLMVEIDEVIDKHGGWPGGIPDRRGTLRCEKSALTTRR